MGEDSYARESVQYVVAGPVLGREEELGEATQVYWKTDNNAIYQVDGS